MQVGKDHYSIGSKPDKYKQQLNKDGSFKQQLNKDGSLNGISTLFPNDLEQTGRQQNKVSDLKLPSVISSKLSGIIMQQLPLCNISFSQTSNCAQSENPNPIERNSSAPTPL